MPFLPDGTPLDIMLNPIGVPSRMNLGQLLETHLGWAANTLGFHARTPVFDGAQDSVIEDQLARAWFVRESNAKDNRDLDTAEIDWTKVDAYLEERGFDRDRLWSDAQSNRGVAREACLRIWLKETAGIETAEMKPSELMQESLKVSRERNLSAPIFGKQMLIDGRTGLPYDAPITVGNVYMLKLIHLVQDKIHARSTGPYSLITQQPLGGKAQFGGQRFGEMEVWALEAYSAAYMLQEMLTIKSDDVIGRVKTYEAIVKGEEVIQPGVPESFHVLLKELQGLGLSVELLNEDIERFTQAQTQSQEMSATLGAPLDWNDLSDEPFDALDIEELAVGDEPVAIVADESEDEESDDSDSDDKDEAAEPTEDSLQTLASEESEDGADDLPGVEDEEN
jgi:DNA-directed RNA polymerase subunit beta